jgi:predicted RNA-binding protein with PUA-like domain
MRAMQQGDLAFFYASGGKAGRKPGIVGIMEVVQEQSPDPSTGDNEHYAYVEKEADRAKWCVVHVEYRKKLSKPVLLSDLQKYGKDGGVLSDMDVLKFSRLSVSRVTETEWDFIHENLIEGFEEEIDSFPASSVVEDATAVVTQTAAKTADALESTYTAITETASNLIQNAASALSPVPTASAL